MGTFGYVSNLVLVHMICLPLLPDLFLRSLLDFKNILFMPDNVLIPVHFQIRGPWICIKWQIDWEIWCLLLRSCASGVDYWTEACRYFTTLGRWESSWMGKLNSIILSYWTYRSSHCLYCFYFFSIRKFWYFPSDILKSQFIELDLHGWGRQLYSIVIGLWFKTSTNFGCGLKLYAD